MSFEKEFNLEKMCCFPPRCRTCTLQLGFGESIHDNHTSVPIQSAVTLSNQRSLQCHGWTHMLIHSSYNWSYAPNSASNHLTKDWRKVVVNHFSKRRSKNALPETYFTTVFGFFVVLFCTFAWTSEARARSLQFQSATRSCKWRLSYAWWCRKTPFQASILELFR